MSSKNEFFKKLIQLNPSSFFVAIFGVYAFCLGFFFVELSEWLGKVKNERQQIILISFMTTTIPLGFWGFINSAITKEKQTLLKEKEQEYENEKQKDITTALDKYKADIKQDLEKVKDSIPFGKLSKEEKHKIQGSLAKIESETREFFLIYGEGCKIAEWLDKKVSGQPFGNRYKLLNNALKAVEINDKEALDMFDKDIWECIQWIHDTFVSPVPCTIDSQVMLSGIGRVGFEAYKKALDAIKASLKDDKSLGSSRHKGIAIDKTLDHLIEKIHQIAH